jgi:DNA-binding XRE family transcriptional regulator
MKNKPKQIMKSNSQSNTILINEIRKKNQLKKERKNKSIGLTRQTRDSGHEIGTTNKKQVQC